MSKSRHMDKKISVVLPGHNEEEHISSVLSSVRKHVDDVIFVDDGSKDGTLEIAKRSRATVLHHITNLGKGAALRTGCDYAVKNGADIIVVMDSDGQHDPSEIPNFLKSISEGNDVVIGCRKWNSEMPLMMKVGNYGLYKISSFFFKVDAKDTQSGYRAFTREAYEKIRWSSNDYSMESEMIARISSSGLRCSTIPIKTIYHDDYKGTTVINGIIIAFNMILWRIFGTADNKEKDEMVSISRL